MDHTFSFLLFYLQESQNHIAMIWVPCWDVNQRFFPFFSHNLFIFGCGAGSGCCAWGLLSAVVLRLLTALASRWHSRPPGRAGLSSGGTWPRKCSSRVLERRLRSCGIRAYLHGSMWDLTSPGIQPVSLALAGRFFTTEPSGKP